MRACSESASPGVPPAAVRSGAPPIGHDEVAASGHHLREVAAQAVAKLSYTDSHGRVCLWLHEVHNRRHIAKSGIYSC
jgi:hypothetical protein